MEDNLGTDRCLQNGNFSYEAYIVMVNFAVNFAILPLVSIQTELGECYKCEKHPRKLHSWNDMAQIVVGWQRRNLYMNGRFLVPTSSLLPFIGDIQASRFS